MKICVFTNHFYPEDFKVNDIAFDLSKKGMEITVITAIPDYPKGKFFDGYSFFKKRKEIIDGVKIYRLPIIPRGNGSKIKMVLNYASYFISTLFFTYFRLYRMKFDSIFVHLTSPFFIGLPAVMLKRKLQIPLIFWTLDLWPESLSAAGGINNKLILKTQINLVKYVYSHCDKILIGSQGFQKSICAKGDFEDNLIYFPNWAEDTFSGYENLNIDNVYPFSDFMDDDFIILFAGNIGEAQDIASIIEAAALTKENQKIKWVFLGDGRERNNVENKAYDKELQKTVFFPGRYPLNTMSSFMKRADILLVSLKDEEIFNLTVPSKVQFYMAQGKPILGSLNGDGAQLIAQAQCGYCVPAGDYYACAEIVKNIFNNRSSLNILGMNGKEYYNKNFQKEDRMIQLESLLKSSVSNLNQIDIPYSQSDQQKLGLKRSN